MTRALLLSAAFATFLGLGCKHVAGRNDCFANPADAILPTPNNPYHPVGPVFTGSGAAPEPDTKDEPKKDEPKKDEPKKEAN